MQKIVIDTNVIVSALIGSSYPRQILYNLVFERKVIVCLSPEIFSEYVEVLGRDKFRKYPEFVAKAEIVLSKIYDLSIKYLPATQIDLIEDDPDNRILELGFTAQVDYIVTGNTNDFTFSEQAMNKIGTVMKKNNPDYPFEFRFVDDQFNAMYLDEITVSRISGVFAILAIIISCLGLFGLAAFTAEQRTKEIGIRKVLGASVSGITALISKDFLVLVLISCLIAFPIAGWVMHLWLQSYEYRISMGWWIFLLAGLLAIVIAMATISSQAIRAAMANPIKSLRTE